MEGGETTAVLQLKPSIKAARVVTCLVSRERVAIHGYVPSLWAIIFFISWPAAHTVKQRLAYTGATWLVNPHEVMYDPYERHTRDRQITRSLQT